jgi:hypothetical protein
MLDVLFALDRVNDTLVELHVYEALEAVALCESGNEPFTVLISASSDGGLSAGWVS